MKKFNMVEIVISLVISVIIITGILGLLPLIITNNQKAIDLMNSTVTADLVLNTMMNKIKKDKTNLIAIPSDFPVLADLPIPVFADFPDEHINLQYLSTNEIDSWDPLIHRTGIFKITHKTSSNVDFTAYVKMWKTIQIDNQVAEPISGVISGPFSVAPTNEANSSIIIHIDNGDIITRKTLHDDPRFSYEGYATMIRFTFPGQKKILIDGEYVTLSGTVVLVGRIKFKIYNSSDNSGIAIGQWVLEIDACGVTILPGTDQSDGMLVTLNAEVQYPLSKIEELRTKNLYSVTTYIKF